MKLSVWTVLLASLASSLGAQPGTKLWQYGTSGAVLSSPALDNGKVYVGSYDQSLHAVNAATGNLIWKFSVDPQKSNQAAYIYSSPAIAPDGTIYFGTDQQTFNTGAAAGNLYALNPDGTLKWKFAVAGAIYSDPAIGADGTIYFGCFDHNVYAINPNGTLKWKFQAANTIFSDVTVAADGTLYFGCDDHNLYALNPNGTKKWTFDVGGPVTASAVVASDGTVYIGSTSSFKFYALNPDGTKKWEYVTGSRIYSSAALGADGTIIFGSNDKKLYALNTDGTLKWQFSAGGQIRSSPAIASDGTVYVGCDDGRLYSLNDRGGLLWSGAAADYIYSSPLIGSDGVVYVGSADRSLYAFQSSGNLAATQWPMFRHDALHSARVTTSARNTPPVISKIADQVVLQNSIAGPLSFTVGDAETAADKLRVVVATSNPALLSLSGVSLSGTGPSRLITMTPAANQTGTVTVTLTVSDEGNESATTAFSLSVTAANHPPILELIADQSITEGVLFSVAAKATDSDSGQALTFSLGAAPAGVVIDSKTGLMTWTPSEDQGPGVYQITIAVSDNGDPSLKASQSFSVAVKESNTVPRLANIVNKTIETGGTLTFTVQATDSDIPTQTLIYSLITAPAGATIDARSGVFRWSPTQSQGSGTYPVTVLVSDDGSPNLTDQLSFSVTASTTAAPMITSWSAASGTIVITWSAMAGKTYKVQYATDILSGVWTDLAGDIVAQGSIASKEDKAGSESRRFYRVVLLP